MSDQFTVAGVVHSTTPARQRYGRRYQPQIRPDTSLVGSRPDWADTVRPRRFATSQTARSSLRSRRIAAQLDHPTGGPRPLAYVPRPRRATAVSERTRLLRHADNKQRALDRAISRGRLPSRYIQEEKNRINQMRNNARYM